MIPAYQYRAVCRRVIDADSLICDTDLGFRVTYAVTVRIRGLNAPELNEPGGAEAKAHLIGLVTGKPLILQSYKDRQSFARWICDLYVEGFDRSVAETMIADGHGTP